MSEKAKQIHVTYCDYEVTDLFSPNRNTETTRNQNPQHE